MQDDAQQRLERDWIKSASAKMLKSQFDVAQALGDRHLMIDSSLKPLILKAAYLVAAADGKLTQSKATKLTQIASGLRMSDSDVRNVLAELEA